MKTRDPNLLPELRARMALLHETLFEQPEENRYSSFVKRGRAAYPELVRALDAPITEQRIDALLALGASIEREGASPVALAAVGAHARARTPKGAEQHASLFALGKSRDPSILRGFTALLADDEPERIRVACWLLGHARHSPAAPQLAWLATHDGPAPVRAA
ncbi:hypothetical protein L6R52_16140, partial [Myxococcota bacterium]|nr:hypothetical protein [Myxococcota bacterium]